jgi:hypothetical protein
MPLDKRVGKRHWDISRLEVCQNKKHRYVIHGNSVFFHEEEPQSSACFNFTQMTSPSATDDAAADISEIPFTESLISVDNTLNDLLWIEPSPRFNYESEDSDTQFHTNSVNTAGSASSFEESKEYKDTDIYFHCVEKKQRQVKILLVSSWSSLPLTVHSQRKKYAILTISYEHKQEEISEDPFTENPYNRNTHRYADLTKKLFSPISAQNSQLI